MNINKKLELWAKAKIISSSQKKAILEYETSHRYPLFLYSLLFLSSFCIGLGMIAVIASNWQIIPAQVKLVVDFLILIMLGGGVFYAKVNQRPFLTETLLILYAIFVLASIGLIAQLFQLTSQGMQALLFWSVIVSPLMFFSKRVFFAFFWLPVFIVSLSDILYDFDWLRQKIDIFKNLFPDALTFIMLLFFVTLYRVANLTKLASHPLNKALRWWALLTIVAYVFISDIFSSDIFSTNFHTVEHLGGYRLILWLGLALLTGAFCWFNSNKQGHAWAIALFVILDFILIRKILPSDDTVFNLWGASQSLVMLSLAGVYAYKNDCPRLLNWISALMALRFFIVYIQVFGSILLTGLGLIISGLVFLGVAYGWYKLRFQTITSIKETK